MEYSEYFFKYFFLDEHIFLLNYVITRDSKLKYGESYYLLFEMGKILQHKRHG